MHRIVEITPEILLDPRSHPNFLAKELHQTFTAFVVREKTE